MAKERIAQLDRKAAAEQLETTATRMMELAERLKSDDGPRRPFHPEEIQLLKTAYFCHLEELTEELKTYFMGGHIVAFEAAQERLHSLMRTITDL